MSTQFSHQNPFEFDAATNLSDEMILEYYIDDFNHSRFIQSTRNIFLLGERGSGKTMALLHNTWRVQALKRVKLGQTPDTKYIGVYIPCNTPLTHRAEYQLLRPSQAAHVSEHFLVLSVSLAIISAVSQIPAAVAADGVDVLSEEVEFVLGGKLPPTGTFFGRLAQFLQLCLLQTQRAINRADTTDVFYEELFSFSSLIVPLLLILRRLPALAEAHFLLMIDDAQSLNEHQVKALNSWVAFRDHSFFSFKVAIAKVDRPPRVTASGGTILEGHDFTSIDLQEPYQNKDSDFGRLAARVIEKRLANVGIDRSAFDFFPLSGAMARDLEDAKVRCREEAIRRYGASATKAITDHVYKYYRVDYFRSRSAKANRVPYSGFELLVFLSTGVMRNLLEPCYWMYDKCLSTKGEDLSPITEIPSTAQTDIILELSRRLWEWARTSLDQDVEGCSRSDAERSFQLLDKLAELFRQRLQNHQSEPRALSFTISDRDESTNRALIPLLKVLRKAQLLFLNSGPAKDKGRREVYYIPNRMLWPDRGLDPQGQHARVSIKAKYLVRAAYHNVPIPMSDDNAEPSWQQLLWEGDDVN